MTTKPKPASSQDCNAQSAPLPVTADEHGAGWFEFTHELDSSLPDGFPCPELLGRDRQQFHRIGREGWTGYLPPEDSAVAPDLAWTDAHEVLVIAAYRKAWAGCLEENQTYEIVWPPVGYLTTEGQVVLVDRCVHHGDPECFDCDEFEETTSEISPARWSWSVRIETFGWEGTSGALEDSEWFRFLTTLMDPRDIDYAP